MKPRTPLPQDHLIADPDLRARVEEVRRKAADGSLLAESYGKEELLRYIEEGRRRSDR